VAWRVTASAALVAATANRDRDDAMTDATARPDTATTTPIECTLPTIIADYEQIDAYFDRDRSPGRDRGGPRQDHLSCTARSRHTKRDSTTATSSTKASTACTIRDVFKELYDSVDIITFSVIIGCEGNIDMKNGSGGFYPAIL
jgi:hypothetical protein